MDLTALNDICAIVDTTLRKEGIQATAKVPLRRPGNNLSCVQSDTDFIMASIRITDPAEYTAFATLKSPMTASFMQQS